MKHILDAANIEALRQYACSSVLVGLDYDGTLAPIVAQPDEARMRSRTRKLLADVARLYPCVVISGRAQTDLLRRLRGLGRIEAIGNHGLEPSRYSASLASEVQRWMPIVRRLSGLKGVVVENKVFSLAIHYRQSRQKKAARAAIVAALSSLERVRVIGGKLVYNVLREGAPLKGAALLAARERYSCDTALYIGDDDTDEDVFALEEPGRLLSIRVGASATSRASYFIRTQREVDSVLTTLLACRRDWGSLAS